MPRDLPVASLLRVCLLGLCHARRMPHAARPLAGVDHRRRRVRHVVGVDAARLVGVHNLRRAVPVREPKVLGLQRDA
eukprot:6241982-Prymnesium_polylepis.1